MFSPFFGGLVTAATPENLVAALVGCVIGTFVSLLPGLGPAPALALVLPFTLRLDPITAIILLSGIYHGTKYGSAITSILINTPAEASAVVTTFDGYPMARKGLAGKALGLAAAASFFGGVVSALGVILLALPFAAFAVDIGPPEYVSVIVLGLLLVASVGHGPRWKALLAVGIGLALGTVGLDPVIGRDRFTFGLPQLSGGLSFVIAAMGTFAFSEILYNSQRRTRVEPIRVPFRELWPSLREIIRYWRSYLRGTITGFFIGLLPGAGATTSAFVSYGFERRVSKTPERFGTGAPEGLVASEASINGAAGGAMLPLMILGVPSSIASGVMLGALILYGLQPGPLLFAQHPHFVWAAFASLFIANVLLVVLNWPLIPFFASVLRLRYEYFYPILLGVLMLSAYTIQGSVFGIWELLGFGLLGYLFRLAEIPVAPMILALILGPLLETSVVQSFEIGGGPLVFVQEPLALAFILIACAVIAAPGLVGMVRRPRGRWLDGSVVEQELPKK